MLGMATAELSISADNVTLPFSTDPQNGSVEVYVQFTEGTDLPTLFGPTTYVTLSPAASGVSFTDFGKTIDHLYVFPTGGQGGPQGSKSASHIDVTDYDFGGLTLQNNAGLVRIDFQVGGGMTGKFDVLISTDHAKTFLTDDTGLSIYYDTYNHGSITIVPEPASLVLILMGAFTVLCWFNKFRRNA